MADEPTLLTDEVQHRDLRCSKISCSFCGYEPHNNKMQPRQTWLFTSLFRPTWLCRQNTNTPADTRCTRKDRAASISLRGMGSLNICWEQLERFYQTVTASVFLYNAMCRGGCVRNEGRLEAGQAGDEGWLCSGGRDRDARGRGEDSGQTHIISD